MKHLNLILPKGAYIAVNGDVFIPTKVFQNKVFFYSKIYLSDFNVDYTHIKLDKKHYFYFTKLGKLFYA